ncbi:ABC-type branched-chain amino acid transport system, permease component [Hyella patelloides LEGE 07179]|uniref:ABC-type branched-chain amino acid transport system, permease component n=1 Tax=Hyella patelloides LEGE 07179 TaxID=945734 RepID=A0A563W3W4_9CYAN|nr:branched-chain amino acid ABC transporter permease [Hyella patelloides]VEP18337.1 ABC-type branched-chain amino acid transport system, permease component [Hyella patelloides LEGE 07179]
MVGYLVFLTTSVGLFAIFALGLNLQWGFTGLINFGHVAFMTVGAYTTVLLSSQGVPLFFAVIAGAALASLLGFIIGLSTLRLREDYLAIVTIGVSEVLRLIALNEEWLTRGAFGVQRFPLPMDRYNPNAIGNIVNFALLTVLGIFALWQLGKSLKAQWREGQAIQGKSYKPTSKISLVIWGIIALALIMTVYINSCFALSNYNYKAGLMLLVLLVLAVIYWGLQLLVTSPWGRVLKAIREDEEIPRALGKNVFWYKLQAFMIGGAIAGIAGSFYAWQLTTIYPDNFQPLVTFNVWTMVVLGGAGSNAGSLLGVIIFWAYDALTRSYLPQIVTWLAVYFPALQGFDSSRQGAFRIMVIGLILMILMVWRPQGILGKKEELTLGR